MYYLILMMYQKFQLIAIQCLLLLLILLLFLLSFTWQDIITQIRVKYLVILTP